MRLPAKYKISGLNEKILLKKMMSGRLPDQIISRTKQPYRAPVLESFFGENAPEYVEEMLSQSQVSSAGIFNPSAVDTLVAKMKSGRAVSEIDSMAITGILSTQILNNLFVASRSKLTEQSLVDCPVQIIRD